MYVPWLRDPFNTEIVPPEEKAQELVELKVSNAMKLVLYIPQISSFCLPVSDSCTILSNKTFVILVLLATTCHVFATDMTMAF